LYSSEKTLNAKCRESVLTKSLMRNVISNAFYQSSESGFIIFNLPYHFSKFSSTSKPGTGSCYACLVFWICYACACW